MTCTCHAVEMYLPMKTYREQHMQEAGSSITTPSSSISHHLADACMLRVPSPQLHAHVNNAANAIASYYFIILYFSLIDHLSSSAMAAKGNDSSDGLDGLVKNGDASMLDELAASLPAGPFPGFPAEHERTANGHIHDARKARF